VIQMMATITKKTHVFFASLPVKVAATDAPQDMPLFSEAPHRPRALLRS
jgi:hypothetical protein